MALGRGQSGRERSYNATKELVWNAIVETLSDLKIAVKKADKNKGEIQSESEPRASEYYSCELHDKRGRPPREGFWVKGPKGKLVAWIKESSSSHTSLRIQLEGPRLGRATVRRWPPFQGAPGLEPDSPYVENGALSGTRALMIQRGPSNPVNFSNLQYSLRARVTRCWSSAFRMPEVAELRSHTPQFWRGAQL